jgi:hypothetical protein
MGCEVLEYSGEGGHDSLRRRAGQCFEAEGTDRGVALEQFGQGREVGKRRPAGVAEHHYPPSRGQHVEVLGQQAGALRVEDQVHATGFEGPHDGGQAFGTDRHVIVARPPCRIDPRRATRGTQQAPHLALPGELRQCLIDCTRRAVHEHGIPVADSAQGVE